MNKFSVAALQLEVSHKNNLYLVQAEIEAALRQEPGLKMLVVGELASYGSRAATAQEPGGEAERAYCELAAKHEVWLVPGSIFERDGEVIYNTALAINPQGAVVARYRKVFPFVPYEANTTPGDEFVVFDVPDVGRFGLCICYDIWYPELTRSLAWMGAQCILCPTMTNTHDRELELCFARAAAAQNQCYLLAVNVAGELGNGQSIAVDPHGTPLKVAGSGREIFSVELDFDEVRKSREHGVLGLGQALKSFRDRPVQFPPYAADAGPGAFAELGPLAIPARGDEEKF